MRIVVPLAALILSTAASPQAVPAEEATVTAPAPKVDPTTGRISCTDRIHMVRAERGLPWIDRGTAPDPDEPLLLAAVDKRIDGCSVLVMRNDANDIRPLPTEPEGPARVQRIPN
jgi:hypothetical protein